MEENMQSPKEAYRLPSVEELKEALAASEKSDARALITSLFDRGTFVELGTYTKRSFSEYAETGKTNEFEGVIGGYGAVDGRLTYAFAQDVSRMGGAMDERQADKIVSLYEMAIANGAPIVGIYNSTGADITEGVSALAAYGRIMRESAKASGVVPQISVVAGLCTGSSAPLASMADFLIAVHGSYFYIHNDEFNEAAEENEPISALTVSDAASAVEHARILLSYLPANAEEGVCAVQSADNLNRLLGEPDFDGNLVNVVTAVSDNGIYEELSARFAPELFTAFTYIGGVRCGVVGNRSLGTDALLDAQGARKAAHFVSFCDAFSIPLVTFTDVAGFAFCDKKDDAPYAAAFASLAMAYAKSAMPKITVILGKAIGGAYTLLGSKSIGADVVYALEDAEIGALPTEAAVAFAWNDRISEEESREKLENEWRRSLASPVAAASRGEVDDIITVSEMRQRIASALLMLAVKGTVRRRHPVLPV